MRHTSNRQNRALQKQLQHTLKNVQKAVFPASERNEEIMGRFCSMSSAFLCETEVAINLTNYCDKKLNREQDRLCKFTSRPSDAHTGLVSLLKTSRYRCITQMLTADV